MVTHFAPIDTNIYNQTTLRTEAFTQSSFYAQLFLHREVCAQRNFCTQTPLHRGFDAKKEVFTYRCFVQRFFAHIKKRHVGIFTHRTFATEKALHRTIFTHRFWFFLAPKKIDTEKIVHTYCAKRNTHRFFCTQKLYPEQFLHSRNSSAQKPLRTVFLCTAILMHNNYLRAAAPAADPGRMVK